MWRTTLKLLQGQLEVDKEARLILARLAHVSGIQLAIEWLRLAIVGNAGAI